MSVLCSPHPHCVPLGPGSSEGSSGRQFCLNSEVPLIDNAPAQAHKPLRPGTHTEPTDVLFPNVRSSVSLGTIFNP